MTLCQFQSRARPRAPRMNHRAGRSAREFHIRGHHNTNPLTQRKRNKRLLAELIFRPALSGPAIKLSRMCHACMVRTNARIRGA